VIYALNRGPDLSCCCELHVLFTALLDCVANGASCVAVCLVRALAIAMRVGRRYAPAKHLLCAVYCVANIVTALVWALAVDMRCRCVFRQEDICTVLVSKIVFLQELGPGACGRSVLGRC